MHNIGLNAVVSLSQQQIKTNRRMMVQSCIITVVLGLQLSSFWLFPKYVGGYLASYVTNTATIVNSVINPVVYMLFNPMLRGIVKQTLGMKWGRTTAVETNVQEMRNKLAGGPLFYRRNVPALGKSKSSPYAGIKI